MLQIVIDGGREFYDEAKNEFFEVKKTTLQLEHSLLSLKKWESKWHKPFLGKNERFLEDKTEDEILDYIRCMTITPNVDPNIYNILTTKQLRDIFAYIQDPMTATWFGKDERKEGSSRGAKKVITAEVIYYWMIKLNIPIEFQKWHLNQLMTLIRVIDAEESTGEKMSRKELLERNARINAERRAKAKARR